MAFFVAVLLLDLAGAGPRTYHGVWEGGGGAGGDMGTWMGGHFLAHAH
jgi:hypothetical protein